MTACMRRCSKPDAEMVIAWIVAIAVLASMALAVVASPLIKNLATLDTGSALYLGMHYVMVCAAPLILASIAEWFVLSYHGFESHANQTMDSRGQTRAG